MVRPEKVMVQRGVAVAGVFDPADGAFFGFGIAFGSARVWQK